MSDWVTDRLPTEDESDSNEDVLVPSKDCTVREHRIHRECIELGDPWYPLPKAYEPPKPKRYETHISTLDNPRMLVREVLPGDPTPEAIEEVAAELEVIAETIRIASDLQILADRGMYAEGIKRQAAKLRGKTD